MRLEIATEFFRAQGERAFALAGGGDGLGAARRAGDTLVFRSSEFYRTRIVAQTNGPVPGRWFASGRPGPTVLHFHGGGYVFAPAMTDSLVAAVADAIGGRTFAPDYRLAPAHPFPAQLDDALRCYQWLAAAHGPQIVVTGDSAGGHLALALQLTLARMRAALPVATVAISPWIDIATGGATMRTNAATDWITAAMLDRLAAWAGTGGGRDHPLFRLAGAEAGLFRRVLIHDGEAEILHGMVRDFCARAVAAGADISYASWPDMNHNFHGFGDLLPQSRQALGEIASFVQTRIREAA